MSAFLIFTLFTSTVALRGTGFFFSLLFLSMGIVRYNVNRNKWFLVVVILDILIWQYLVYFQTHLFATYDCFRYFMISQVLVFFVSVIYGIIKGNISKYKLFYFLEVIILFIWVERISHQVYHPLIVEHMNRWIGTAIGLSFLSLIGMIVIELHLMYIPQIASYQLNAAVVPKRPEQEWINTFKSRMDNLMLRKKDWIQWEKMHRKSTNGDKRRTGTNGMS